MTWRQSVPLHGTPGSTDAIAFAGNPAADLDQDGFTALVEYAFGTSDTNPASLPGNPVLTLQPDGSTTAVWPLQPNADDAVPTTQSSPSLTNGSWNTHTNQPPAANQEFLRLHLRLR